MTFTNFPTPISSTCTVLLGSANGLAVQASCTGTPPTTASIFEHGCLMYKTDGAGGASGVYQNTGTTALPVWTLVDTALPGTGITSINADTTDAQIIAGGAGLTVATVAGTTTLTVGAGNGITVNADDVALASSSAGAGLTYITGVLAVGAGTGITVNADDVALAASYTPTHVVKFGGKITWSGSGATLATAVPGVVSTDIVTATVQTKATEASYLVSAAPTVDTLTLELSAANTSNDAVIAYTVFRAV